jgi:ribosome-associated heat shock protein Hsp15
MAEKEEVRIDKWLWAVRLFKTRSKASNACKKGQILIDDQQVKPSRNVRVGETVTVKKKPVFYKYRVTGLLEKRQSATIARKNLEDITPEKELKKLEVQKQVVHEHRPRGWGRPTKKERRMLDKFKKKGL